MKIALLGSIFVHMLLLIGAINFRGKAPLPGLIEVDIVIDMGRERGAGEAQMPTVETGSKRAEEKGISRKDPRHIKANSPLAEGGAVSAVRAARPSEEIVVAVDVVETAEAVQLRDLPKLESVRTPPVTVVTGEAPSRNRATIPFTNADYQATVPATLYGYSAGRGAGAGGRGKVAGRQFRSMVLRRIEAAKIYPERARRRGIEGDATVDFTVLPDGTVEAILVTDETRCHTLLKRAAVRTVQRAAPYLPLPASIQREEGVRMKVKITFHLS